MKWPFWMRQCAKAVRSSIRFHSGLDIVTMRLEYDRVTSRTKKSTRPFGIYPAAHHSPKASQLIRLSSDANTNSLEIVVESEITWRNASHGRIFRRDLPGAENGKANNCRLFVFYMEFIASVWVASAKHVARVPTEKWRLSQLNMLSRRTSNCSYSKLQDT